MIRVVALLCFVSVLPLRAEEARYSTADLKALEKTGQWEELLNHLDDVPAAQRNEAWEAMGLKAAEKFLRGTDTEEQPFSGIVGADVLAKRYRFLGENARFKKARRDVALKGFENCFNLSYTGAACIERMLGYVNEEPAGSELAFRAGRITARQTKPADAVVFFKKFLDGKAEREECREDAVVKATVAALDLPNDNALVPEGREIASSLCPEKMRPYLLKALAKKVKGSNLAKNSCRFLKEGGGLGAAEESCKRN